MGDFLDAFRSLKGKATHIEFTQPPIGTKGDGWISAIATMGCPKEFHNVELVGKTGNCLFPWRVKLETGEIKDICCFIPHDFKSEVIIHWKEGYGYEADGKTWKS